MAFCLKGDRNAFPEQIYSGLISLGTGSMLVENSFAGIFPLAGGLLVAGVMLIGTLIFRRWFARRHQVLQHPTRPALEALSTTWEQEISDHQQAGIALRKSSASLSLALKAANVGTWHWNLATNQAVWSEENCRLLGYEPGGCEPTYEKWLQAIHPNDRGMASQTISQVLENQQTLNLEYRVLWPDGTLRWLADIGEITYDSDGNCSGMVGLKLDITERKQAEIAQQQLNQDLEQKVNQRTADLRYRLEFEHLISSISTHFVNLSLKELEAGIHQALGQITEFAGFDRSYLVLLNDDQSFGQLAFQWHAPGIDPLGQEWQTIPSEPFIWWMGKLNRLETIEIPTLAQLPAGATAEHRALESVGTQSLLAVPLSYDHGLVGYIGFAAVKQAKTWSSDAVTMLRLTGELFANALHRQQTETALRLSEARFQSLATNIPGIIYQYLKRSDGSDAFLYISQGCRDLFELDPAGVMQDSSLIWGTLHPEDLEAIERSIRQSAQTMHPWHWEGRIITPSGQLKWLQGRSRPKRHTNGDIVWDGVLVDISDRKHIEAMLQGQARQQSAVAQLGQLALESADMGELMHQATVLVTEGLDVEYCKLLELLPDGSGLLMRAGVGWQPGLVGHAVIPTDAGSQAGYTLSVAKPVIVENLSTDPRFNGPKLLQDHQVVSGLSVILQKGHQPFGVIGAHTQQSRTFTQDDVNFLQAVANILSTALERLRAEAELQESESRFRQLAETIPEVFYLSNLKANQILYISPAYETIWGRSCQSLYEQPSSFLQAIHQDDRPRVELALKQQCLGHATQEIYRVVKPDGTLRWVHDHSFPICDKSGEVLRICGVVQDITEQKRNEESLRQLGLAVEHAMTGISRLDTEGHFTMVRRGYAQLVGYDPEDLIGQSWEVTVPEADHPVATVAVQHMLDHGRAELELRGQRKDGSIFYKYLLLVKAFDANGNHDGHYCFMRDISDRKQAELEREQLLMDTIAAREEATRAKDLLASVFERMSDGIVGLDTDWRYTYVNEKAGELVGRPASELIGKNIWDVFPDAVGQSFYRNSYQAMEQQIPVYLEEYYEPWDRWFENRIYPSDDGLTIYFTEITDRKRAERSIEQLYRQLEEHNRNLEALVHQRTAELVAFINALPDYIYVVERDTMKILFCNDQLATVTHFEHRDAVQGKTIFDCFPQNNAAYFAEQNRQVFESGTLLRVQESFHLPSGEVHVDTFKIPLKRPNGETYALIGTSRDITELITARRSLTERTVQLEATNQELESFSYSVSHDLRAPLRHIHGFVNALRQRLASQEALTDPKVAHYLQVIDSSSQKMGHLIDGLLTLSRIGRKPMTTAPVSLDHLVAEAISVVQPQGTSDPAVEFDIGSLPTVQGDATLLQQVLVNLIDNAVKFSSQHAAPRIEIGSLPNGVVFVRDNGAGFQMEYADKLFGAFQRLHAQTEFEGTGIGLAIVQRIIHRHGGRIWAEGAPNQGAAFYFTIGASPR